MSQGFALDPVQDHGEQTGLTDDDHPQYLRSDAADTYAGSRMDFEGFVNLSRTTLTVASGAVTATGSFHLIDTEGGAATDDLNTINGAADGDLLILRSVSSARDTTIKDAVDNIFLFSGDYTLATTRNVLVLIAVGTSWFEVSRN